MNPTTPASSQFQVADPAGRIYRLSAAEVMDFYNEKIRGIAKGAVRAARDEMRAVGTVLLQLINAHGELADVRMGPNLITTVGLGWIIDRLDATLPAVADYLAVGTNSTAASAGDTTLGTEIGTRVQGTLSQPTATTSRLVGTFAAANGTGALVECGRFNAASTGTLVGRQVFSVINKAAGDSLQITYDITVS